MMAYGAEESTETQIICQFAAADNISCWVGDPADGGDFVTGDASAAAGITSASGGTRVFAGLRDDPFFMEFTGFVAATNAVKGAGLDLRNDPTMAGFHAGCPEVDAMTSGAVVGLLQGGGADGMGTASDTFEGSNVLSIVLSVDKNLINGGGPILGLWASTHSG